jgi:hypothetical protein
VNGPFKVWLEYPPAGCIVCTNTSTNSSNHGLLSSGALLHSPSAARHVDDDDGLGEQGDGDGGDDNGDGEEELELECEYVCVYGHSDLMFSDVHDDVRS